jgi:hypothetical protein
MIINNNVSETWRIYCWLNSYHARLILTSCQDEPNFKMKLAWLPGDTVEVWRVNVVCECREISS